MKRFKQIMSLACILAAIGSAQAAFLDDFSDSSSSKLKWITVGQNLTLTFANGECTIKNSDTVYTGFLIHNFSGAKPATFTLSAKFTITDPSVNGAGLMYCLNSASQIKGYTLQIGVAQYLYAYKYDTQSGVITNKASSAITPTTNVIKVSKSGDLFNLFCNGKYITKFNETTFPSGDVAIVIPPKSTVTIDDVVMIDQFEEGALPTCFEDSFKTTDIQGWNTSMMQGNVTIGAGALILNDTSSKFSSIIYNNEADLAKASMKTYVANNSGTGMYGLTFVSLAQSDPKTFAFCVSSDRRYHILFPDSASPKSSLPQSFVKGSLGKDTLEVIRYGTKIVFKINDTEVPENIPIAAGFRIDGAGLYAGSKTAASFNYFIVGGDSTGAKCNSGTVFNHRLTYGTTEASLFGKDGIVYNSMGRKIGTFTRNSFNRTNLVNGLYIIQYRDVQGKTMKSMRLMKTAR
jgi:hypothetical protein